ncbi:hypothetical protein SCP_0400980 [Sparassis crispa]|uniref:Uncharacterized protein n=1 Tax=Sparassis crispa TaxID=139825 RepID=A0A401GHR9_9APHY|nr:hypothetical protein SCP_0400980 [Sparassis crispa]GBE81727.1 hypothetical protein SCP_0400980 [Sparassis crispa]
MLVDKMNGREDAVNAFILAWTVVMASKGIPRKVLPPFFNVRACCATRSTISPPPPNITDYDISLAAGQDDVESLIPFAVQFSVHVPHRSTAESARIAMGRYQTGKSGFVVLTERLLRIRFYLDDQHRAPLLFTMSTYFRSTAAEASPRLW